MLYLSLIVLVKVIDLIWRHSLNGTIDQIYSRFDSIALYISSAAFDNFEDNEEMNFAILC